MAVLLLITLISHLAADNNPIFPSALRFDWSLILYKTKQSYNEYNGNKNRRKLIILVNWNINTPSVLTKCS